MKVLFIVVGDRNNSNSRERVWAYLPALKENGFESTVHIAGEVSPGIGGKLAHLAHLTRQSAVFVHRVPLALSERAALAAVGARVIFDLDDAIWYAIDPSPDGGGAAGRHRADVEATLRMSALVRVGNGELAVKAREYAASVTIAPTCVEVPESAPEPPGPVTVGWIGHSGNYRYFEAMGAPPPGLRFKVVADVPPPGTAEFKPWRLDDEIADVRSFHIGVMPLLDTPWARGKCGYKILLYMAHGRPVVASPVGVNAEFVTPDRGFLARTPEEWRAALATLAGNPELRRRMGEAGRRFVMEHYSRERGLRDLLRDLS